MPRIYGMDVSNAVSQEQWKTFLDDKHIGFAIVRVYRNHNGGMLDENAADTIANAVAAGVPDIGVYHFPVVTAKTAQDQITETLDFLTQNSINYSTLWIDVEGDTWHEDTAKNVEHIDGLVQAVIAGGGRPGIYTGSDQWRNITGNSTQFQTCPLYWSSHGKSYTGPRVIGGWAAPTIVQYAYERFYADVHYDSDYKDTD
jgi:Glycosyl hydrolases family 25